MKLFFRKYGSGPPLVILHGLYGSSDNWVSIAKRISDRFTVYLPDQRNHGQSPHSSIHDYSAMTEDLYDFINDLDLKKFYLAGHSMGGKTAVNFSLKWPEKLYGLLVADISPFTSEKRNQAAFQEHYKILSSILLIDLKDFKSRDQVDKILTSGIDSEEIRGFIMKNLRRESDNSFSWKLNASALLENLGKIMDSVSPSPVDNDITEITGFPVYFLKGELSGYLSEGDYSGILRIFPGAEFILIPHSGHWIHPDNPAAVINCLLRFLDSR